MALPCSLLNLPGWRAGGLDKVYARGELAVEPNPAADTYGNWAVSPAWSLQANAEYADAAKSPKTVPPRLPLPAAPPPCCLAPLPLHRLFSHVISSGEITCPTKALDQPGTNQGVPSDGH